MPPVKWVPAGNACSNQKLVLCGLPWTGVPLSRPGTPRFRPLVGKLVAVKE